MNDREKLIELLRNTPAPEVVVMGQRCGKALITVDVIADHLIANGVTISPVVPGHDNQYNIAEMAYRNGYAKGFEDGQRKSLEE